MASMIPEAEFGLADTLYDGERYGWRCRRCNLLLAALSIEGPFGAWRATVHLRLGLRRLPADIDGMAAFKISERAVHSPMRNPHRSSKVPGWTRRTRDMITEGLESGEVTLDGLVGVRTELGRAITLPVLIFCPGQTTRCGLKQRVEKSRRADGPYAIMASI